MKVLILQGSPRANGNTAWMAEEYKKTAEAAGHEVTLVNVSRKKIALLMSSYSPGVYDGATAEFRDICNYWQVENMGFVSARIDEQKTDETKQKVVELASKL